MTKLGKWINEPKEHNIDQGRITFKVFPEEMETR